jgi:hypothetical protein
VLSHVGYRVEAARAELAAGFERLIRSLRTAGYLDERSASDLHKSIDRSLEEATTLNQVLAVYRRAFPRLQDAIQSPIAGSSRS